MLPKSSLLLVPVLALSACGNNAVTIPVVMLSGVSGPLAVGATAQLTLTDGGGSTVSSQGATFTSSDSNAVSVDQNGVLTAQHLNASGVPVVITVSANGAVASLNVSTYGLDASGGTYNAVNGTVTSVSPLFYLRFRAADGSRVSAQTTVTVTPPSSAFGDAVTATLNAGNESTIPHYSNRAAVSGVYTASLSSGGRSYSKSFSLDASKVLPAATGISVTSADGVNAAVSGSLPGGAAAGSVTVNSADYSVYNYTDTFTAVPSSLPWLGGPLARGSYGVEVDAYSARRDTGVSTPAAFNVSAYTSSTPLVY